MGQNVFDAKISKGRLELNNLPFADEQEVSVTVMPKFKWNEERMEDIRNLLASIKGNLSQDIIDERGPR